MVTCHDNDGRAYPEQAELLFEGPAAPAADGDAGDAGDGDAGADAGRYYRVCRAGKLVYDEGHWALAGCLSDDGPERVGQGMW